MQRRNFGNSLLTLVGTGTTTRPSSSNTRLTKSGTGSSGQSGSRPRMSITGIRRDAVNGFLKRWEASPQFRDLRQRFESLLDRVGGFLRGVSESVPSLRPKGNSAKLLAKLSRVRTPARQDTKMRYLIAVLEDLDTRTLVRNQDIPPRRLVPRTTSKKVRSPPPSADPALAWTLVGVILSVFIGVAIGLFPFAGWI